MTLNKSSAFWDQYGCLLFEIQEAADKEQSTYNLVRLSRELSGQVEVILNKVVHDLEVERD